MRRIKVLLEFVRFSIAIKIEYYRNIITRMTGNPKFPEPDVALTLLTTAVTTLETDFNAAQSGSHEAKARLGKSEKAADVLFRKEALYVDRIADGDPETILGSGYETTSQPKPRTLPVLSVEHGKNPQEIFAKCKKISGARSYVWQICEGDFPAILEKDWILAGVTTRVKITITGLKSQTKYWVRVRAVSSEGMQPWLDPLSAITM